MESSKHFLIQAASISYALLFLLACGRPEPTSYRIPKEERSAAATQVAEAPQNVPPSPGASSTMQVLPGMSEAAAAAGEFSYSVPEGWEEFPPSGIRKANFRINDGFGSAEMTVLVFPGDVGGDLANINRWREQIGLGPISPEDLPRFAQPYRISNHRGLFVQMSGPEQAILGGLLPFHGFTWFFKMQGSIATVLSQEDAVRAFLDSVVIDDPHH